MDFPILTALILLPVVGGILCLLQRPDDTRSARALGLTASLVTLFASLPLFWAFKTGPGAPLYQFVETRAWVPSVGLTYKVGIDGMALLLILLTTLLTPVGILASWTAVAHRARLFYACLLFLQASVIGVFAAMDLVLFYVFWEVMLVPMLLLIGIWGSKRRLYAAVKFFIYTMAGSLLMLAAIVYTYFKAGAHTFDIPAITAALRALPGHQALSMAEACWLFAAFALAFCIKVPLFPFHTWLPDAHTEAPTAGSVMLAAVLLKMGTYGLLRLAIPFFPEAAAVFAPYIALLAVIGIVYGALMALAQTDMKRLIAYSSVSHLGYVVLGIMAWNEQAVAGAIYQMLGHGLSTGALFLVIGAVYERHHTREIAALGGIAKTAPALATVFMIAVLSSAGLPGLNGFPGEFLILLGTFQVDRTAAAVAALGVILGAVYLLTLYQKTMLGTPRVEAHAHTPDLNGRELLYFAPVVVLMVVMGLFPAPFLERMSASVKAMLPAAERLLGS